MTKPPLKPIKWVASAKKDLVSFPQAVQQIMGVALMYAQYGEKHPDAKPLQGFGEAGVLEVVEGHDGDTYRAVYTVKFKDRVYVLHCFQKKSKKGIKTPQSDIDLIKKRLKAAEEDYKDTKEQ